MSVDDIKLLCQNDLCVVVAKDPGAVKFVDPLPAASCRTQIEDAAIKLSRRLLNWQGMNASYGVTHADVSKMFAAILVDGTPLDPNPTNEERERAYFTQEKMDEIRRLAREEARAERAAAKVKKPEVATKSC